MPTKKSPCHVPLATAVGGVVASGELATFLRCAAEVCRNGRIGIQMNKRVIRAMTFAMTPLVAFSCASESTGGAEDTAATALPILHGTTVTQDLVGSPALGNCSSTLLRDRWVLTAKHCGAAMGSPVTSNGVTATVTDVFNHPSEDVSLLRLNTPLNIAGGYYPLYRGPKSTLMGQNLYCQGRGNSECTDVPNQIGCSGFGTLRSAILPVTEINGNAFKLSPNGLAQIQMAGDSGSSCLTNPTNAQRRKWTGVDCCTATAPIGQEMWFTAPDMFRDWAGGIIGSAPSVGGLAGYERSDTNTAIVYRNGSNIRELSKGDGNWSVGTLPASTASAASDPTAFVRTDGWNGVAYRGTTNHIHAAELFPGGSWQAVDLSNQVSGEPDAQGNPAAFVRSDRVAVVLYRGADNHVIELNLIPGAGWGWASLTQSLGNAWKTNSDPIGYVRADGTNAVVYRSADNHIRQLHLPTAGAWVAKDLNVEAPSAALGFGTPHAFTRSDGVNAVVYRTSSTGDIWLLSLNARSSSWQATRVVTGGATSDPIGYVRADGVTCIVYRGSNGHIFELSLGSSGTWASNDLYVTATGAPPNVSSSSSGAPTPFVRGDRVSAIAFKATSTGHVWELRLPVGGTWAAKNLTQEAGGTL